MKLYIESNLTTVTKCMALENNEKKRMVDIGKYWISKPTGNFKDMNYCQLESNIFLVIIDFPIWDDKKQKIQLINKFVYYQNEEHPLKVHGWCYEM